MGRLLQIRVSASTYRPEDVVKAWPKLASLAWPQGTGRGGPVGVLELVDALGDRLRFGDLAVQLKQEAEPGITRARYLKRELEEALADWKAARANELSDKLEQVLDETERAVHP